MTGKNRLKERIKIWGKLLLAILLIVLFIRLIAVDSRQSQGKQPEGELIKRTDVEILLGELLQCGVTPAKEESLLQELRNTDSGGGGEYITYGSYLRLIQGLFGEKELLAAKEKKLYEELTYSGKYRDDFRLLQSDWYESYQKLLQHFHLEDNIYKEKIEILCSGGQFDKGQQIPPDAILTKTGIFHLPASGIVEVPEMTAAWVYLHGGKLLTVIEVLPDTVTLENAWVMEALDSQIYFFWNGFEMAGTLERAPEQRQAWREQVADLSFAEGQILRVDMKSERISGKLLAFTEEQAELEGYGRISFADNCMGYRLYGTMQCAEKNELILGSDLADFVLDRGKICAFLITNISRPETIRVAIKNSDFTALYHEQIELEGEDGLTVRYGPYDMRRTEEIPAGVPLVIDRGHELLEEGRIEICSKTNTGKICVNSITRNQGLPSYRGSFEIVREAEGLVLINEVPLEEYLYSVVPSEMPSGYPEEALKAQAICARTYGYRYTLNPGYGYLGAHVDDSVSFQVYNNIAENINSTKAVRETSGMMLTYENVPVNACYYSTSCGYGTDAGIWGREKAGELPYLKSRHIAKEQNFEEGEGEGLTQEEAFRDYITAVDKQAYEKEEPWFRWSYEVEKLDVGLLTRRLQEQQLINGEKIRKVYDISCTGRRPGGVAEELLIETDAGRITVDSEYKIRYVLNQGGEAVRQDGSGYESAALLPSAYMIIDVVKSKGNVVGYKVVGGGFGHGVGMSQNGARAMALEGMGYEEILSFYYQGSRVQKPNESQES